MCKNVDGATSDCAFKRHDLLKCPKGHPLHLSYGKTFLVCRSGCDGVMFFTNNKMVNLANKQLKIKNTYHRKRMELMKK